MWPGLLNLLDGFMGPPPHKKQSNGHPFSEWGGKGRGDFNMTWLILQPFGLDFRTPS